MKFLFATLLITMTFNAFAQSRQQERDRMAIHALIQSVELLAGSDLTCESHADCLMISVGSRACGGPSGYILASKQNDNFSELESLARSSEVKERIFNQKYEVMSTCEISFPPQPSCQNYVCGTSTSI